MKQRITIEDISVLSEEQKQMINDLWIPALYDVAVATVCTDVEEEAYEKVQFVVGGIQLYNRTSMILHDIRYLKNENENETEPESEPEAEKVENEEAEEFEFDENDIDFSYSCPTSFNKEDCIPLLTIGQLIDILQKKGFGYGDFYLAAGINDMCCEIGKAYFDINNNYDVENDKKELCDVLWEYVKTLLQ